MPLKKKIFFFATAKNMARNQDNVFSRINAKYGVSGSLTKIKEFLKNTPNCAFLKMMEGIDTKSYLTSFYGKSYSFDDDVVKDLLLSSLFGSDLSELDRKWGIWAHSCLYSAYNCSNLEASPSALFKQKSFGLDRKTLQGTLRNGVVLLRIILATCSSMSSLNFLELKKNALSLDFAKDGFTDKLLFFISMFLGKENVPFADVLLVEDLKFEDDFFRPIFFVIFQFHFGNCQKEEVLVRSSFFQKFLEERENELIQDSKNRIEALEKKKDALITSSKSTIIELEKEFSEKVLNLESLLKTMVKKEEFLKVEKEMKKNKKILSETESIYQEKTKTSFFGLFLR